VNSKESETFMITSEELHGPGGHPKDDAFEILVRSYRGKAIVPVRDDLNWRPATDVYETEDAFVVQMDLAGMDPASIEVLSDGVVLVVRGTRQDIAPPGKKHYFTMEISVGPFARYIDIPIPVKAGTAVARYRTGFLYVSFRRGDRDQPGQSRRIGVDEG